MTMFIINLCYFATLFYIFKKYINKNKYRKNREKHLEDAQIIKKHLTNLYIITFVGCATSKTKERQNLNPETALMNEIRVAAAKYGICFRANVGKVKTIQGRWFDTGLPTGFCDLFGIRKTDGKVFFIEVKTEKGKVRDSQKKFIKKMKDLNAIAGIARTVDEAIELIETGTNNSTEILF